MTAALILFITGMTQIIMVLGWRNSFLKNSIRDDKEYDPENEVLDKKASEVLDSNNVEELDESEMVDLKNENRSIASDWIIINK